MPRWVSSALLLLALVQAVCAQTATGVIGGRVSDAQTGVGVAGATLQLVPETRLGKSSRASSSTSLGDGTFRFENVQAGTYFLVVSHPSYVSSNMASQTVSVTDGQQISDVAVQLSPLGSIRGRVLDDSGHPEPGATVKLLYALLVGGKPRVQQHTESSQADVNGEYVVKKVGPGRYYILAGPGSADPETPKKAETPDSNAEPLVPTFYPKAPDLESATAIKMQAAQELSGMDIRLRRAAVFHVRGKVEGFPPESSIKKAALNLSLRGSAVMDSSGQTVQIRADGTFEFEKVTVGSYTLWITGNSTLRSRHAHFRVLAHQDIDLNASDLNDIVLSPLPPVNVTGHVTFPSTANATGGQVFVNLIAGIQQGFGSSVNFPVDGNGNFAAQDLDPGLYSVRLMNAPGGSYVQSIEFNRQDVKTSGLDLSSGGSGDLQIVLRSGAAEVDGTLLQSGLSEQGMAVLVPQTLAADGSGVMFGGVNPNGAFTIHNVAPGRYFAYGIGRYSGVWQNADFLREMERQGTALEVQENGHSQLQLPLLDNAEIEQTAARLGLSVQ